MDVRNKRTNLGDERYFVMGKFEWNMRVLTNPKTYSSALIDLWEQRKYYPELEPFIVEIIDL